MKVELDLSNYATKVDLKNATGVDTSKLAKKVDLASLKSEVHKWEKVPTGLNTVWKLDKFNVNKLKPVAVDLSKWFRKKLCY